MIGRRALLAAAIVLAGCEDHAPPSKDPPPRPGAASAAASDSAAAPGSAAAPAISASAAAPKGESDLAGTWEGAYEAKKGVISLPPKVKDKALAADDGKKASGAGTIEITIADTGEVKGSGKGALGVSTITGKIEETMLRATLLPEDPRAPGAMTGVLVGTRKGDVIKAEIHAAGPDATVVREASFELKKKK